MRGVAQLRTEQRPGQPVKCVTGRLTAIKPVRDCDIPSIISAQAALDAIITCSALMLRKVDA